MKQTMSFGLQSEQGSQSLPQNGVNEVPRRQNFSAQTLRTPRLGASPEYCEGVNPAPPFPPDSEVQ
jgi:hypothetical protein